MSKKLTDAQKEYIITSNAGLVPEKSKENFYKKTLDEQYTLITNYIRKDKEKHTIQGKVKQYLKGTGAKPEDVKEVIEICSNWLERNKTKLINNLDEQIKKLQEEKEKYSNL